MKILKLLWDWFTGEDDTLYDQYDLGWWSYLNNKPIPSGSPQEYINGWNDARRSEYATDLWG